MKRYTTFYQFKPDHIDGDIDTEAFKFTIEKDDPNPIEAYKKRKAFEHIIFLANLEEYDYHEEDETPF